MQAVGSKSIEKKIVCYLLFNFSTLFSFIVTFLLQICQNTPLFITNTAFKLVLKLCVLECSNVHLNGIIGECEELFLLNFENLTCMFLLQVFVYL